MEHHPKFEHSRFVGDKRTQFVYDLDTWEDEDIINDIVDQGVGLSFGSRHARRGPQSWVHAGDGGSPSPPPQALVLSGPHEVM